MDVEAGIAETALSTEAVLGIAEAALGILTVHRIMATASLART